MMFRWRFGVFAGMGSVFMLCLSACSSGTNVRPDLLGGAPTAALKSPGSGSLPFTVIDSGAPTHGGAAPFALALRSDQGYDSTPRSLPEEARHELEAALAADQASLYLILYAGEMPSSGFSVQIQSIAVKQEDGNDALQVRYYVQPPDPQSGAATVLTHPYLIVSLSSDLASGSVRFEQVRR